MAYTAPTATPPDTLPWITRHIELDAYDRRTGATIVKCWACSREAMRLDDLDSEFHQERCPASDSEVTIKRAPNAAVCGVSGCTTTTGLLAADCDGDRRTVCRGHLARWLDR